MKLISWNVNGLRACVQKGFMEYFKEADADIFCLQETKLQGGQIELDLPGYHQYWNYAEKKGYSGTALFTKEEPLKVSCGIGVEEHDHEGRVITAEYKDYYVITVYVPNSQRELTRLAYRMEWEAAFLDVAHREIDLKNPKSNRRNAGFTDEERECFTRVLENGFVDTFRHFYPDLKDAYSWWSYMGRAREKNVGWRIDYFLISDRLRDQLTAAHIHADVHGSDHCPVSVELAL